MPTTRVMPGIINMEGSVVNTLKVGQMVSRHPRPRYDTTCERCGTRSTESQDRLVSGAARCLAASCGKPPVRRGRDLLSEHRELLAKHEAQRLAEQREVSARRMEAEAEGWERPTKYAPDHQPHQVMTERERIALRERREAEEQERREAERPLQEAERKAAEEQAQQEAEERSRSEKQRMYWAEWVQSDRDPRLFVTDSMRSAKMPTKDAEAFTAKSAAQFAAEPEYAEYRTLENADVILGYLHRNGVFIADVETIRAAFQRLRGLGLLKQKPAPAPQPPVERPKRVNLAPEPAKPKDELIDGWDLISGEPRKWTPRELDRLSSMDYRKALRLYPDKLALPVIGPGPKGSR